jgi:hypothetical protein
MLLDQPSAPAQDTSGSRPAGGADRAVRAGARAAGLAVTALPTALVLALGAAIAVGVTASALHWHVVGNAWASRLAVAVVLAVTGLGLWALSRSSGEGAPRWPVAPSRGLWVASVPGLLLMAYAAVAALLPLQQRLQWFLGGDHVRHFVFVAQVRADGYLDYASNPYPRGWHTLLALLWSAAGGTQDAAGLLLLMTLMPVLVWCLYAVLTLAVGHLAYAVAQRCGLADRDRAIAGLGAGVVMLGTTFLANYQSLGFENSLVAMLVLVVAATSLVTGLGGVRALVVSATAAAVMAHAWQLGLPTSGAAAAIAAVALLRRRPGWRTVALVGATALVAAAVALPGIFAVTTQIGVGAATDADVPAPLPALVLPAALLSCVVVGLRWRRDPKVQALLAMVLVTVLAALAIAAYLHIPPTQYFPAKLLMKSVVLALAPLGVVVAVLLRALRQRSAGVVARAASRGTHVVAGLIALVWCVGGVLFAVFPSTASAGPDPTLDALTTPGAASAQVVWLPGSTEAATVADSTITRILLDFYSDIGPTRDQAPLRLDEECRLLARASSPTVLSSAPEEAVRARYSCAPAVSVITVVSRR